MPGYKINPNLGTEKVTVLVALTAVAEILPLSALTPLGISIEITTLPLLLIKFIVF